MENNKEIKKIGIVLSGGFARGSAQLAFVKELIKKIGYERVAVLSGSSIGAINAYAISVKHVDEMLNCYSKINADSVMSFFSQVKGKLYDNIFDEIKGEKMYCPVYWI